MIRYLAAPETLRIHPPGAPAAFRVEFPWPEFLRSLLSHSIFATPRGIDAAADIEAQIVAYEKSLKLSVEAIEYNAKLKDGEAPVEAPEPDWYISMDGASYVCLKKACEEPEYAYTNPNGPPDYRAGFAVAPWMAQHLRPYRDSVLNAHFQKPPKVKKPEAVGPSMEATS